MVNMLQSTENDYPISPQLRERYLLTLLCDFLYDPFIEDSPCVNVDLVKMVIKRLQERYYIFGSNR